MGADTREVFVVDSRTEVVNEITGVLKSHNYEVTTFTTNAACYRKLRHCECDLLICEVKMPGMDGIVWLKEVKRIMPYLPVLIITNYADIPMAIKVIKMGVADIIEKPLDRKLLLDSVESALQQYENIDPVLGKSFTQCERRVLKLILSGKSNKEIACLLHRSIRTVEEHRRKVMRKLGVNNVVDLVKKAANLNLPYEMSKI